MLPGGASIVRTTFYTNVGYLRISMTVRGDNAGSDSVPLTLTMPESGLYTADTAQIIFTNCNAANATPFSMEVTT